MDKPQKHIALPQMGAITYALFDARGRRSRNVKVVYIDAGQKHWSYEIRDPEVKPGRQQESGFVEADNLTDAISNIDRRVEEHFRGGADAPG